MFVSQFLQLAAMVLVYLARWVLDAVTFATASWTVVIRALWEPRFVWVFLAALFLLVALLIMVRLLDLRALGRWLENHLFTLLTVLFFFSFAILIISGVREKELHGGLVTFTFAVGAVILVLALRERLGGA